MYVHKINQQYLFFFFFLFQGNTLTLTEYCHNLCNSVTDKKAIFKGILVDDFVSQLSLICTSTAYLLCSNDSALNSRKKKKEKKNTMHVLFPSSRLTATTSVLYNVLESSMHVCMCVRITYVVQWSHIMTSRRNAWTVGYESRDIKSLRSFGGVLPL